MNYSDVLKILTTPPPPVPTTQLTIVAGRTRVQIAALLHAAGDPRQLPRGDSPLAAAQSVEVRRAARHEHARRVPVPVDLPAAQAGQRLEVGDRPAETFKQEFAKVNLNYARSKHLTPYDVLIIASIIEEEAATSHDLPLVSSVIYNRLKAHMPLGMDSTTRYEFNDYTKPLTQSQLAARSPYNTRLNTGLPPTPIGNPGMAAIEAAAAPGADELPVLRRQPVR